MQEQKLKKIIFEIGEDYLKQAGELQKSHTEQTKPIKKLLNIIKKFKNKKLSKTDIQEILNITCWKSLAFCCDKECFRRNICLKLLKISKEDFYKLKKEFNEKIRGMVK